MFYFPSFYYFYDLLEQNWNCHTPAEEYLEIPTADPGSHPPISKYSSAAHSWIPEYLNASRHSPKKTGAFDEMDRRLGPRGKSSSPLEYIHMYSVSCMRWSILVHAPIHFGECACPFYWTCLSNVILANVSRIRVSRVSRVQHNNNNNGALVAPRGSRKVVSTNQTQHTQGQEKRRPQT